MEDTEQINAEFVDELREALFEVVEDLLQTDHFKVRIEPGSRKGNNFIGNAYRIIFSTADERKSSNLYLKVAPDDETRRKQLEARMCFLREIYVYEKILPFFRQFQESREIIVDRDGFYEHSKCYKSIDTEPIECLFLQDLSHRRFSTVDKQEVTVEHILLVMKAIGKFHAVSLALKDQQPDKFAEIVNELHEPIYKHEYNAEAIMRYNKSALNVINSITEEDDAHLLEAVLQLYERNQFDIVVECVDGNDAEPYSVVVHGDLWSNNTLFQFNDKKTPMEACLIDWQICRYASPVLDVLYYIFCTTTRELRGRNYNTYLRTYHESISNHLIRLGSDPDEVFPYSAFQAQLQKYGKFGLLNASFVLPILLTEKDSNLESIDLGEKYVEGPVLSNEIKKRLRDIVKDAYRLGYI